VDLAGETFGKQYAIHVCCHAEVSAHSSSTLGGAAPTD